MPVEVMHHGGAYRLSDDSTLLDIAAMHAFLREAYWCRDIPFSVVQRSVAHSLCIGAYEKSGAQVGLARFISDYATFCYVCDVYVLAPHRNRGIARAMLSLAQKHPQLQGLRRWMLVTRDAQKLYRLAGFACLAHPQRHMELSRPNIYREGS
jgi:ribosomal protein S18 acetylase RimI-like enzyme